MHLLQKNKNLKNLHFQKAFFSIKQNKYKNAKKDFIEYLKKGGDLELVLGHLKTSPQFSVEDSLFFVQNEKTFYLDYLADHDYKLIQAIQEWYAIDQYFNIWKNKVLDDRIEQQTIRKIIFQKNLLELKLYVLQNNGQLPQFENIGYFQKPIILMVMHHTRKDSIDEQTFQFFKKILRDEICNRFTYSPNIYVHLIDNMQLVKEDDHKQVYGQHIDFKSRQILPLKYPKTVDSLRAEIGLLPLKLYAESQNVSLPENYYYGPDSNQ